MISKKYYQSIIAVLFCFLSITTVFAQQEVKENTLIWKVEKLGQKPSYLVGTMHIAKKDDELPEIIRKAYLETNQLVVEANVYDISPENTDVFMRYLLNIQGNAKKDLGEDRFNQAVKLLLSKDDNYTEEQLSQVAPWVIWESLQYVSFPDEFSIENGIDMQLVEKAQQDNKSISSLESVFDTVSYVQGIPLPFLLEHIDEMLISNEDDANLAQQLYQYYRSNQPKELVELLNKEENKKLVKYLPETAQYWQAFSKDLLLTQRNLNWMKPLLQKLGDDSSLVAVGGLHLYGPNGLVELLRKEGYRVTPVYSSFD